MKTKEQFEELVCALGFDPSSDGVDLTVDDMVVIIERLLRHVDVLYERINSLQEVLSMESK